MFLVERARDCSSEAQIYKEDGGQGTVLHVIRQSTAEIS